MVLTDRKRRGDALRAVCGAVAPSIRRLLALGGLAAAGWLVAGAAPVAADTLAAGPSAVLSAERLAAPSSSETADVTGLTDTHETGEAARHAVGSLAHGAGVSVAEAVGTGREIGARLDRSLGGGDTALTEQVSEGLAQPAAGLRDGLGRAIDPHQSGGPLTGLAGDELGLIRDTLEQPGDIITVRPGAHERGDLPAEHPTGVAAESAQRDDAPEPSETPEDVDEVSGDQEVVVPMSAAPLLFSTASDTAPDETPDPATSGGRAWGHAGSDSAGTVSSSSPSPGPAAAGFLAQQFGTLRPLAERVALPGDPTLVVRDAADDPSFSPD
ncbi:hypothetical protein GCM10027294_32820 [Marinactinospora endophytica]